MRLKTLMIACLLALMALPAAATFTPLLFTDLQAELGRRLSQELAGTLGKRERKQRTVALAANVALAKPGASVAGDVKVARSTQASLAKAFPDEFRGATGPTQLGPLYQTVFDGLTAILRAERSARDDWRVALPPKNLKKFDAQLAAADKQLASHALLPATDFKRRGARLASIASALAKATAVLDKAPPSGLHAVVDGVPWTSSALVVYFGGNPTLLIRGARAVPLGGTETIEFYVRPVADGPGVYPLDSPAGVRGGFRLQPGSGAETVWSVVPGTGSVTVEKLERHDPHKRARLSFSFTARSLAGTEKNIAHAVLDVIDVSTDAGTGF